MGKRSVMVRDGWHRGLCARCFIALAVLVLPSCSEEDERRTLRDVGYACLMPQPEKPNTFCTPIDIPADEPLFVFVDFQFCPLSDSRIHMSCNASREGSTIVVTAEGTGLPLGNGDPEACPGGALQRVCELEPLPAGAYEFRYGELSFAFDVPSTTSNVCASGPYPGINGTSAPQCCDVDADCRDGRICSPTSCQEPVP